MTRNGSSEESGGRRGDAALVASLLAGCTVAEAAKRAAISERTAFRRLANACFRAELHAARQALLAGTVAALVGSSGEAAATLRALLSAHDPGVRQRAARSLLDCTLRSVGVLDLEQRILAVEQQLARLEGELPCAD